MDNSVPSEGENKQPLSTEINFDQIENEAYKWVFHTFDRENFTKDQISELIKMYMRKHVYQLQFEMAFEKYQSIVPKYEEIARRLDNLEVLKNQASEGKDAVINEQKALIRDLLDKKEDKDFKITPN
jgi:hypothetical protein